MKVVRCGVIFLHYSLNPLLSNYQNVSLYKRMFFRIILPLFARYSFAPLAYFQALPDLSDCNPNPFMRIPSTWMLILGFSSFAWAQSIVQLPQNPLLISPSFAGLDSNQRLCFAAQNYKETFYDIGSPSSEQGKAYFASYDRRIRQGKSALGVSFQYWDYSEHALDGFGQGLRRISFPMFSTYLDRQSIATQKWEGTVSYVPRFLPVKIRGKSHQLIPALQLGYSHIEAQEAHVRNTVYNDSAQSYSTGSRVLPIIQKTVPTYTTRQGAKAFMWIARPCRVP